jgi:hypothetical protein
MISGDPAPVLVNEVGCCSTRAENELQQAAAFALGADFTAADEITLRHNANKLPSSIDDRKPANVPFQHEVCGLQDGGVRQDGKDRPGHALMRARFDDLLFQSPERG